MTHTPASWTVGVLVESEREITLKEFRSQLPGNHTLEECVAWHVRQIDQVVTHKSGGRISIHTHVMGKRKVDDVQRYEEYITIPSGHGRREHQLS